MMEATHTTLTSLLAAAATEGKMRLLELQTFDRVAALELCVDVAIKAGTSVWHYSATGRMRFDPQQAVWRAEHGVNTDVLAQLEEIGVSPGPSLVILEDAACQFSGQAREVEQIAKARMMLAKLLAETKSSGCLLVLLEGPNGSDTCLPQTIAGEVLSHLLPLPDTTQLTNAIVETVVRTKSRTGMPVPRGLREVARQAAICLTGMSRTAAEHAVADLLANGDQLGSRSSFEKLLVIKRRLLEGEPGLQVLERSPFPLGLDRLERFLTSLAPTLAGTEPASGVLLLGQPGTGKSMAACGFAEKLQLPVLEWNLAAMFGQYVGQTEKQLARALAVIEAHSPLILYLDEIDKMLASGGAEQDGGTSSRLVARLHTWFASKSKRAFVVATANNMQSMGERALSLTRSGRMDALFWVDLPGPHTRLQVLTAELNGKVDAPAEAAAALVEETRYFSGADLVTVIKRAAAYAALDQSTLTLDRLREQVRRKRTAAQAIYEQYMPVRRWAQYHCEMASSDSDV